MGETDLFFDKEYISAMSKIKNICKGRYDVARSYVYFISDTEFIKVGIADEIASRMSSLQTGNGRKLELFAFIPFVDRASSINAEKVLHELFSSCRLEGEWFDVIHNERFIDIIKHIAVRDVYRHPSKRWAIVCTADQRIHDIEHWRSKDYVTAYDYANLLKNKASRLDLHGTPTHNLYEEYVSFCNKNGQKATSTQKELTKTIKRVFLLNTKSKRVRGSVLKCFDAVEIGSVNGDVYA